MNVVQPIHVSIVSSLMFLFIGSVFVYKGHIIIGKEAECESFLSDSLLKST